MNKFYVYCYSRPDCGTPIYIGKGCHNRDVQHLMPSHLERSEPLYIELRWMIREGLRPIVRRLVDRLTEPESIYWEKFFIAALGRTIDGTGPLLNQNLGGIGTAGYKFPLKSRMKSSMTQRGRPVSLEQRFKLVKAKRAQFSGRGISREVDEHHTQRWVVYYGNLLIGHRHLYCEALLLRRIVEEADTETFEQWCQRVGNKPTRNRVSRMERRLRQERRERGEVPVKSPQSFNPLNHVQSEEDRQRILRGTADTPEAEAERRRTIGEGCKAKWQEPEYIEKMKNRRKRGKARNLTKRQWRRLEQMILALRFSVEHPDMTTVPRLE